jgi:hypothetical protein
VQPPHQVNQPQAITTVLPKLNKFPPYLLLLVAALFSVAGNALVVTPDIVKLEANGQPATITLLPDVATEQVVYKLRPLSEEEWDKSVKLEVTIDRVRKVTLSGESPFLILDFHEEQPIVLSITALADPAINGKELRARLWGDSGQPPILLKVQTNTPTPPTLSKSKPSCQNKAAIPTSADSKWGFYLSEFESHPSITLCNAEVFPQKLQYNFYQIEFDDEGKLLNRQTLNANEFQTNTDSLPAGEQTTIQIIPKKQHDYFVMTVGHLKQEDKLAKLVAEDVFVFTQKTQAIPEYQIAAAAYHKLDYSAWLDLTLSNQGTLPMTATIELVLRNTKGKPVLRGVMSSKQALILPQQDAVFSLEFPGYAEYQHQPLTAEIYITLAGKYQRKHLYAIKID